MEDSIGKILQYLDNDESIVYPTSTLPALGCKPTKEALDTLFKIKNRSSDLPVSLAVLDLEQASELVEYNELALEIIDFFPKGSLTLLLPAKNPLDKRLGGDWVAVRPIVEKSARQLVFESGPITATSANISGKKPQKDCEKAAIELDLNPDQFISGLTTGGAPSTLVKLDTKVTVMREGVISREEVIAWSKKRN